MPKKKRKNRPRNRNKNVQLLSYRITDDPLEDKSQRESPRKS